MKKKDFIELINYAQKFEKEINRWNDFGIEIFELPIVEIPYAVFDKIWEIHFSEEGVDWITWWLYERISIINGEELPYYDENNIEQYARTSEDLWELVKDYQLHD